MPASGRQIPEAQLEVLRQQREGISADGVEGDVAEVEQPGEPTTMFSPQPSIT
jgi:hypothetical protein